MLGCAERVETIDARLSKEIDRLDAALKSVEKSPLPEELKSVPKAHRQALLHARAATSPDERLYRLRAAFVGIEMLVFLGEQPKAAQSMDALRGLWNERRASFEARHVAHGPLLQRALAEAAGNRAARLFHASLPYAVSTRPFTGLYYFAEAEGNRRFRDFVASLPGDDAAERPSAGRVRAELQALETETLAAFDRERSGRTTISVSAHLKEARELLEQDLVDGAALTLVESRLLLERKKANDNVPALLAAMTRTGKVAAAAPIRPESVTVTLVRWPYT